MTTYNNSEYNSLISKLSNAKSFEESEIILNNHPQLINKILFCKLTDNEFIYNCHGFLIINYIIEYLVINFLKKPSKKEEFFQQYASYLLTTHALYFSKNLSLYYLHTNDETNYDYTTYYYKLLTNHQIGKRIGEADYKTVTLENLEKRVSDIEDLLLVVDPAILPIEWGLLCGEKGDSLFHLKKYERAIDEYIMACEVLTAKNHISLWASTQKSIGHSYLKIAEVSENNIAIAIKHFEQSIEYFSKKDFPYKWANIHQQIGESYLLYKANDDNVTKSLDHYNLALQVFTIESYPKEWASLQLRIGNIYYERIIDKHAENIELAIKAYQLSKSIFNKIDYPEDWAMLKYNLGNVYNDRVEGDRKENIELSIKYYLQALEIINKEKQSIYWININLNLSNLYITKSTSNKLENLQKAQIIIDELLSFISIEEYQYEWAKIHATLGLFHNTNPLGLISENQKKSLYEYNIAKKVFADGNFYKDLALTQNNIGNIYINYIEGDNAENIEKSIELYKEALKFRIKSLYPLEWADTTSNLAIAFTRRIRGDRDRSINGAIKLFNDVLKIRTEKDYPFQWANTLCNLNNAYAECVSGNKADNIELAINTLQLTLNVYKRDSSPLEWATVNQNLGLYYMKRKIGDLNTNLEFSINSHRNALEVITKSVYTHQWAIIQLNLGYAYYTCANDRDVKYLNLSIDAFRLALEVFTPNTYPKECKSASFKCGQSYCLLEKWSDARQILEVSHEATEVLRQQLHRADSTGNLSDNSYGLYYLLIHSCIKLSDDVMAFNYVQSLKGRTDIERLQSLQSLEDLTQHYPELSIHYKEIDALQIKLDKLTNFTINKTRSTSEYAINITDLNRLGNTSSQIDSEISLTRQNIKSKLENISYQFPLLTSIQYSPIFNFEKAKKLAKDLNSTLIEYFHHPDSWIAFVVDENQCKYIPLKCINTDTIKSMVNTLNILHKGNLVTNFDCFEDLYEEIWKPILPYITVDKNIVIAPHSILYSIPFGALQDKRSSSPLMEKYNFTMASSISFLSAIYEQSLKVTNTSSKSKLLSVVFAGSDIKSPNYLKNVEAESILISKNFNDVLKISSTEATPNNVISYCNKYLFEAIHFGCHGSFDTSDPIYSGLKINGTLNVRLIINGIRFKNSPLVTLAACETGLVTQTSAGDLIGLTQAFFIAGASNVIATLWPVKDLSTRKVLEIFYAKRKEVGVSNSHALQYALKEIRNKSTWKNPLYWAAFQIFGLPE